MNRPVNAERHRVPELLDRLRRAKRQNDRIALIRLDQADSLFDAALLVRAHREAEVLRVDGAGVVCEQDPPPGDRHSLDAGRDPHLSSYDLMRVFSGSNSGAAPATATETG